MWFDLLLVLVLLAASAFFSGAETALFALSRHELHQFRRDPRPTRRLVAALMQRPRQLLLTLMVGNVSVNMFIFSISLAFFQELAGPDSGWGPILGLAAPITVTLLGEILPKGTSIVLRRRLAPRLAPLVRFCLIALRPVTLVMNILLVEPATRLLTGARPTPDEVTPEELRQILEISQQRRIIDADENAMLSGVIQLNALRVRNIMVPRVDVIAHDLHDGPDALIATMRQYRLPKIPIYDRDIDRIIGIVYAKQLLLNPHASLDQLVRAVHFVPELITLTQLLHHFRETRTQIALAVDEFGGFTGLVTAEDVAEEIVGELTHHGDEEEKPTWEKIDERTYRVAGGVPFHDWAEQFNLSIEDQRVSTLAGFVMARLGHLPAVGDTIQVVNVRLTVESLVGRRIDWLRLELLPRGEPSHSGCIQAAGGETTPDARTSPDPPEGGPRP